MLEPPLHVARTPVLVNLPAGKSFEVSPQILHTMEMRFNDFGDIGAYDQNPPSHEVRVVLTEDDLSFARPRGSGVRDQVAVSFDELKPLVVPSLEEAYQKGEFVVAILQVEEFPSTVAFDFRGTWFDWLDAIDGDLAIVGELADGLRDDEDDLSMALLSGSLFYPRALSVHPAFSGQRIGLRLLAHTLWALHRAEGDTAILLAKPMSNHFAPGEPKTGATEIRRLAKHYERIGFRRVPGHGRVKSGQPVPMILRFGEERIPVTGLGSYGLEE